MTGEAALSSEFNEKLFLFILILLPWDYLIFHEAQELFITRRHNRLLLLWCWKIWHGNGEMEFMSPPATSSTLTHPLSSQCENNRLLVHKFNFVLKVRLIIIFVNFPPSLFNLPPIHSFYRFASPTLSLLMMIKSSRCVFFFFSKFSSSARSPISWTPWLLVALASATPVDISTTTHEKDFNLRLRQRLWCSQHFFLWSLCSTIQWLLLKIVSSLCRLCPASLYTSWKSKSPLSLLKMKKFFLARLENGSRMKFNDFYSAN